MLGFDGPVGSAVLKKDPTPLPMGEPTPFIAPPYVDREGNPTWAAWDGVNREEKFTTPLNQVSLNTRKEHGLTILTPMEIRYASSVGCSRQIEAIRKHKFEAHGYKGQGWNIHIEGACGEMAAAKYLKTYFAPTLNSFKDTPDLHNYQVRTSLNVMAPKLIIRNPDKDSDAFILIAADCPNYYVLGWMYGRDAKQPQFLQSPAGRPPAYFISVDDLREMEELPEDVA